MIRPVNLSAELIHSAALGLPSNRQSSRSSTNTYKNLMGLEGSLSPGTHTEGEDKHISRGIHSGLLIKVGNPKTETHLNSNEKNFIFTIFQLLFVWYGKNNYRDFNYIQTVQLLLNLYTIIMYCWANRVAGTKSMTQWCIQGPSLNEVGGCSVTNI